MTTLAPPTPRHRATTRSRLLSALLGIDWILVFAVAALSMFGVHVIGAATANEISGNPSFFSDRQILFVIAGTILCLVLALVDVTALTGYAWVMLGGLLGSLVVVFVLRTTVNGARAWIDLGPFNLQPSEMGKLVLVVVLSVLAVERMNEIGSARTTLFLSAVVGVPALVVFLQPDLGTALVYIPILFAVLFLAGVPWTHFAVGGAALLSVIVLTLGVLPALGMPVLKDYQTARLTAFTGVGVSADASLEQNDPLRTTRYQLDQSITAIGAGGALGKGPENATQTVNRFLPERQTDFIFAVIAEMYGFVGAAGVLVLFGIILWRILRLTARAATQLEQLVAGAIGAMIMFQLFVNVGMNIGIMPITGIPLPFLSHGGSHTITMLAAVGMLLSIHRRRATF